jgi:hypothetical protein
MLVHFSWQKGDLIKTERRQTVKIKRKPKHTKHTKDKLTSAFLFGFLSVSSSPSSFSNSSTEGMISSFLSRGATASCKSASEENEQEHRQEGRKEVAGDRTTLRD